MGVGPTNGCCTKVFLASGLVGRPSGVPLTVSRVPGGSIIKAHVKLSMLNYCNHLDSDAVIRRFTSFPSSTPVASLASGSRTRPSRYDGYSGSRGAPGQHRGRGKEGDALF